MKNITDIGYKFDIKRCYPYLSKNGEIIHYPLNDYNIYYCLTKKIYCSIDIFFPNLYGKDEDDIVNKLLILKYCQKHEDLKYFIYKEKYGSEKNKKKFIIFNNNIKNIEYVLTIIYYMIYIYNFNKLITEQLKKYDFIYFIIQFIKYRLNYTKKVSNITIFIKIFFNFFENFYLKKSHSKNFNENIHIFSKYNIDFTKISNYRELYKVLKKNGFVTIYYNRIVPYVLKHYKNVLNIFLKSKEYSKKKKLLKKNIKNFNSINILKLIDKNINNNYNKKYIKNKFIELSKKI